jgi:hypothetical protein
VERKLIEVFLTSNRTGPTAGFAAVHGKTGKDYLASRVRVAYFLVQFTDD